jgi:molybdopterin converting factor small subunit
MRILLYGRLADVLGREIELPAQAACSIAELREYLAARYPNASEAVLSKRVRACIGDAIVPESHVVGPSEAVEFFPPLSGG